MSKYEEHGFHFGVLKKVAYKVENLGFYLLHNAN